MDHPNEDRLLSYSLGLDENAVERERLAEHLRNCEECRAALEHMEADVGFLKDFSLPPLKERYSLPVQLRRISARRLRIAAVLAVAAMVGGYIAFDECHRTTAVEPLRLAVSLPPDSAQGSWACGVDGVRINIR